MTREEAIKELRGFIGQLTEGCQEVIKVLIPELRESEDERIRKNIVSIINQYSRICVKEGDSCDDINECLAWLEKQKERRDYRELYEEVVNSDWFKENYAGKSLGEEQKPAEWSEEDEEKLKAICTYLRDYPRLAKLGDKLRFNEYCDFLKSLRPSWKPSEEQMEAFKGYIEDFQARAEAAVGGWNNFDVMIRLYEQLKKL